MHFSRGSPQPRDPTAISMSPALAGGFFTTNTTWKGLQSVLVNFDDFSSLFIFLVHLMFLVPNLRNLSPTQVTKIFSCVLF